MSNQLLSKVIAMAAENAAVGPLLEELFSGKGVEIYVRRAPTRAPASSHRALFTPAPPQRPVPRPLHTCASPTAGATQVRDALFYAYPSEKLSFWEVCARARTFSHTAIGYRRSDGGVVLNPPNKATKMVWGPQDFVIVIAEDVVGLLDR